MWAPRVLHQKHTRTPGILCATSLTEVTEVPGLGMGILQNLQKFRVRCGSVTELTEVPGIVARAHRTRIRYKNDIPVPRVSVALAYRTSRTSGYGYECPAELTEALCRAIPG